MNQSTCKLSELLSMRARGVVCLTVQKTQSCGIIPGTVLGRHKSIKSANIRANSSNGFVFVKCINDAILEFYSD